MAYRVFQFSHTVPANTPKATPVTLPIALDNWDIESIDIEVPPGPGGLVGFYIANNGVQWIPYSAGQFIIWDDRADTWYFSDQPNASGWSVVGYNTDTQYPHTVTTRWHVNLPVTATPQLAVVTFTTTPAPAEPVTL